MAMKTCSSLAIQASWKLVQCQLFGSILLYPFVLLRCQDYLTLIAFTTIYVFKGTRSVPWTDLETLALINLWGESRIQQELRETHRTGHLFSIISKNMVTQGFSRTPEQCQTRLKRLKSSFRQCYQNKCVFAAEEIKRTVLMFR